jgi:hypothetical protein
MQELKANDSQLSPPPFCLPLSIRPGYDRSGSTPIGCAAPFDRQLSRNRPLASVRATRRSRPARDIPDLYIANCCSYCGG